MLDEGGIGISRAEGTALSRQLTPVLSVDGVEEVYMERDHIRGMK